MNKCCIVVRERLITELDAKYQAYRSETDALKARVCELEVEVAAADSNLAGYLDSTFSVGDGTAQAEIERLRAEVDDAWAEIPVAPAIRGLCSLADAVRHGQERSVDLSNLTSRLEGWAVQLETEGAAGVGKFIAAEVRARVRGVR